MAKSITKTLKNNSKQTLIPTNIIGYVYKD